MLGHAVGGDEVGHLRELVPDELDAVADALGAVVPQLRHGGRESSRTGLQETSTGGQEDAVD